MGYRTTVLIVLSISCIMFYGCGRTEREKLEERTKDYVEAPAWMQDDLNLFMENRVDKLKQELLNINAFQDDNQSWIQWSLLRSNKETFEAGGATAYVTIHAKNPFEIVAGFPLAISIMLHPQIDGSWKLLTHNGYVGGIQSREEGCSPLPPDIHMAIRSVFPFEEMLSR
jgi:hypothetical protein